MTTDQIRAADTTNDISRDAAAVVDKASEEAKQIVAKARYDAFRMVTDARAEAESILAERDHADAPNPAVSAETAHDDGAQELESINAALQSSNAALQSVNAALQSANSALVAENQSLEHRVERTRALLTDLETRLARIAATPNPATPTLVTAPVHSVDTTPAPAQPDMTEPPPPAIEPGRKAMRAAVTSSPDSTPGVEPPPVESSAVAVDLDYSPSVPAPVPMAEPDADAALKGSFYSRRSAKLPHIGENAGEDSFSAIRSMRAGLVE